MVPDILLITESTTSPAISRVLREAGHRVRRSPSVAVACEALATDGADLALVDLGVTGGEGVAVLRSRTPAAIVLIDSAWHPELGRLLAAGADDFLAKPFSAAQLLARVWLALLGRAAPRDRPMTSGGLTVDPATRQAWLDGVPLALSRLEFDLLSYLTARAGEVVSRQELADAVWHEPHGDHNRTIDVHLSWLRRKLGETAARPCYLHTVRSVGFRLALDAESRRGSATFA
ncbi:DNA-binding response OmpR family regulator [Allocatelliglobosispora scoriae]|uniref:DNA-binding response OmpR family regulator n=1 Tax=Allocatelliglobosispora scoriae TaxID=643052 RepID=A0A841C1K4_9ACTN|nr:response regulator transcription factor [Allocatelliglobosispora scoriae]MBB5873746.1 DNA-binding response OmpR family regulator [Allocatelliglobosispora scoriae]